MLVSETEMDIKEHKKNETTRAVQFIHGSLFFAAGSLWAMAKTSVGGLVLGSMAPLCLVAISLSVLAYALWQCADEWLLVISGANAAAKDADERYKTALENYQKSTNKTESYRDILTKNGKHCDEINDISADQRNANIFHIVYGYGYPLVALLSYFLVLVAWAWLVSPSAFTVGVILFVGNAFVICSCVLAVAVVMYGFAQWKLADQQRKYGNHIWK